MVDRGTKLLLSKIFAFSLLGDHLCEDSTAMHCSLTAIGGAEFPCHMYSQGNAPGRKVGGY